MLSPAPASDTSDPTLTAGPPADEAGGILTIDLSALEQNYKTLRSAATPAVGKCRDSIAVRFGVVVMVVAFGSKVVVIASTPAGQTGLRAEARAAPP